MRLCANLDLTVAFPKGAVVERMAREVVRFASEDPTRQADQILRNLVAGQPLARAVSILKA
jgi:hypothetical protein